jgi:hypothetical protein
MNSNFLCLLVRGRCTVTFPRDPRRGKRSKPTIALMQTPLYNQQGWAHPLKADLRHRWQPAGFDSHRLHRYLSKLTDELAVIPIGRALTCIQLASFVSLCEKGDFEEALRIRWSSRSSKPAVVRRGNGVFDSHALPPSLPCTTRRLKALTSHCYGCEHPLAGCSGAQLRDRSEDEPHTAGVARDARLIEVLQQRNGVLACEPGKDLEARHVEGLPFALT